MKNLVKMMMVVAALLVLGVGQVWSFQISSGDTIYLNSTTTGGPYDNYGGGDFGVSTEQQGTILFDTFCLELGVFMNFDTPYQVNSVSDSVEYIDSENVLQSRDLKKGTKYLFWHFSQETLNDEVGNDDEGIALFNPALQKDVRALQLAIWNLEGYQIGSETENIKQSWLNGIETNYAALVDLGLTGFYDETQMNVKVMNLMYENTYIQSQLYAAPVPEPGTLLLLGSGLAGLALYRRRTRK